MGMDVAHIPMSLRKDPQIGYYSYFTNAHNLARAAQGSYIPEFDQTSLNNGNNLAMINDVSWLLNTNINVSSRLHEEIDTLGALCSVGAIEEGNVAVTSCYFRNQECGKTEYQHIDDSDMKYVSNKHRLDAGGACSICNCELETRNINALLMNIPEKTTDKISITTPYLRKNINELQNKFGGKKIILSKLRSTNIHWSGYNIDNDFSNYVSMYLASNRNHRNRSELLYLASSNSSMAVANMVAISTQLDIERPINIAALPKISIITKENSPADVTLDSLKRIGISRAAINLVLLQSLGSNSDKIAIPSREFGMMERRLSSNGVIESIHDKYSELQDLPIEEFRIPNRQIISQVFKELISPNSDLKVSRRNLLAAKAIGSIVCRN